MSQDPYEDFTVLELRELKEHLGSSAPAKTARIDAILESRRPKRQTYETRSEYEARIYWLEDTIESLQEAPPYGGVWAASPNTNLAHCKTELRRLIAECDYYFPVA